MSLFSFQKDDYKYIAQNKWSLDRGDYLIISRYVDTSKDIVNLMRVNKKTSAVINQRKNPFNVSDTGLFPLIQTHAIYIGAQNQPVDFLPACNNMLYGSFYDIEAFFNTYIYFAVDVPKEIITLNRSPDIIKSKPFTKRNCLYIPKGMLCKCTVKPIFCGNKIPVSLISFFADLFVHINSHCYCDRNINGSLFIKAKQDGIILPNCSSYIGKKATVFYISKNILDMMNDFNALDDNDTFFKEHFRDLGREYTICDIRFNKITAEDNTYASIIPIHDILQYYKLVCKPVRDYPIVSRISYGNETDYIGNRIIVLKEILYNKVAKQKHQGSLEITLVILPIHFYNKIIETCQTMIEPLSSDMYYFTKTTVIVAYSDPHEYIYNYFTYLDKNSKLVEGTEEIVTSYEIYNTNSDVTVPECTRPYDLINLKYDLNNLESIDNIDDYYDISDNNINEDGDDENEDDDYNDVDEMHAIDMDDIGDRDKIEKEDEKGLIQKGTMISTLLPMREDSYTKHRLDEIPRNDIQKFIKSNTLFITNDLKIYKLDQDGFYDIKDFYFK